jgi:acyl-CoA synthetase (AMP-forming)/AMP-acid ligase II
LIGRPAEVVGPSERSPTRVLSSGTFGASIVDVLRQRARLTPDRLAVRHAGATDDSLDYLGLDLAARAVAARLRPIAEPGERAILAFDAGLDFVVAFFGCLYAGIIAVPVAPASPRRPADLARLAGIVSDSGAGTIIGSPSMLEGIDAALTASGHAPNLRSQAISLAGARATAPAEEPRVIEPTALALLMYTSGSTGRPKGVAVSHANLVHNLHRIMVRCALGPDSSSLTWLPHFHDLGLIGGILDPIYAGFPTTIMAPEAFIKRPMNWLRLISDGRHTISGGPNFCYGLCCDSFDEAKLDGVDLSRWDCAFNGAEPITPSVLRRFAATFAPYGFRSDAFYPCYGMAEATLTIASHRGPRPPRLLAVDAARLAADGVAQAPDRDGPMREVVACGQADVDQCVEIVDPVGLAILPERRVGEVWTSDASVAQGYWQRPEENSAVFGATLGAHPGRRFLRTGDLAFRDAGDLFIVGRLKDIIIVDGRNHHPSDIENTVRESIATPSVHGIAAFSIDDAEGGGEQVVVIAEIGRAAMAQSGEMVERLRRAVAERHGLAVHDAILTLPGRVSRTSSGKVRRSAMRDRYLAGEFAVADRTAHSVRASLSDAVPSG